MKRWAGSSTYTPGTYMRTYTHTIIPATIVIVDWDRYIIRSKKYSEMAAFGARFLIWSWLVTAQVYTYIHTSYIQTSTMIDLHTLKYT